MPIATSTSTVLLDRACFPSREQRAEERVRLTAELIHVLGNNEVDLVLLNDVPPGLGRHAITEGVRVYVGRPRGGSRLLPGRPAARRGSRPVPAPNAADKAQGSLLVTYLAHRRVCPPCSLPRTTRAIAEFAGPLPPVTDSGSPGRYQGIRSRRWPKTNGIRLKQIGEDSQ